MGQFSIWHWIISLVYIAVIVIPCWRIARKAGFSGAWSLLAIVPPFNIVVLWVFAFVPWPVHSAQKRMN